MKGIRWALSILAITGSLGPAVAAGPPSDSGVDSAAPTSVLAEADRAFVRMYGASSAILAQAAPPALLVLGDRIVLYHGGERRSLPLLPPSFDELKTVSHLALGTFAVLSATNGRPLGDPTRGELETLASRIPAVRSAIDATDLTADQKERQHAILDASLRMVQTALSRGRAPQEEVVAFARRLGPRLRENVREVVIAYLDELDRRVGELLAKVSAEDQARLRVIITGVHQARIDNATVQYFSRLLRNPPEVSQRIVFAENVYDEQGLVRLLGIQQMARRVGEGFFDDPVYMNRDLFSYPAREYVPTMDLPTIASGH